MREAASQSPSRSTPDRSPRREESQAVAENGAGSGSATRRKCVLGRRDNATIGGLLVALLREEGYRALRAWTAASDEDGPRPPAGLDRAHLSLPYRDGN